MAEPVTTPTLSLQNFFSSTLSSSIIAGDTVIPLNSVPTGTEGFLVIDQDNSSKEVIYYTSKGASSVTCPSAATGRGLGGTTAVSHSSGATVKMNVVSEYWTALKNGEQYGQVALSTVKPQTTAVGPTYIESGCVWSGDAYASTKAASMTAGVLYINGIRLTTVAVTARTFTASKDVYVDFTNNGDGTALITYIDGTTNAASPALTTAGATLRNAIIVVGATNIAAATSVNQGQPTMVLPIASSIAYSVTDSLGNLIYPTSPQPTVIGYRQIIGNITTTVSAQATGLSVPVIIPAGRKAKISAGTYALLNSATNAAISMNIWDGAVGGTQVQNALHSSGTVGADTHPTYADITVQPSLTSASSKTYNVGFSSSTGTVTLSAAATAPAFIKVELV